MVAANSLLLASAVSINGAAVAQTVSPPPTATATRNSDDTPANVLSPDQWRRVDAAVKRGLEWLASQQQPDGSFPTLDLGQPAVTSLCIMAYAAHGHVPSRGPYGARLERAVDYVIRCQKPNGVIAKTGPEGPRITRSIEHEMGACAAYNHGISSLTISEIYGMGGATSAARLKQAIQKSLHATFEMQDWPKDYSSDRGGWRYIDDFDEVDSDLSVTGWELMFLRSARNAGFNVPNERIDAAIAYIRRCFVPHERMFVYTLRRPSRSRAMTGAGILALAHAGYHHSEEAQRAGDWLLLHDFGQYNVRFPDPSDRYHYGLFTCCQAMYQLGGKYWAQFYPPAVEAILANQQPDGSWPVDSQFHDAPYGKCYTTALALLTLGAPNQLLPVYQR